MDFLSIRSIRHRNVYMCMCVELTDLLSLPGL